MAQIVTITNPLTGQPAQVDQLEHTAQQIDDGIGFESTDYPGCYYRMVGGVVEWLNPPLQLGQEYRTTERYLGKPVYTMTKDYGAVQAQNTTKSASIPENAGYGWVVNGQVSYYGIAIPSWNADGSLRFGADYAEGSGLIFFTANEDRVNSASKYILTIKYIKATD